MQEQAKKLDNEDPLSSFRDRFYFPKKSGDDCVYLCGNSLGLQPKQTERYVNRELKNWQNKGVEGHFIGNKPWLSYHLYSKKSLATLLGASEDEVIAMNSLTANLHLAMCSFYQPEGRRTKVLIERGAFPSDFYCVHSQIRFHGLDPLTHLVELLPKENSDYLPTSEIIEKIKTMGEELALVMLPGVQYYTGQFFDLKAITEAAHEVGAFVGFDLAHTIGNLPLTLHEHQVDFAVWCSYKYLNTGPGGVGGLFVHERHAKNTKLPRLSGWWGHDARVRFKMDNLINPIPSIDGWQLSNVNILTHAAHLASLEIFDEANIQNLRKKSIQLTGFMEELITKDNLLNEQVKLITPSNHKERGCQLSLYLTTGGKEVFNRIIRQGIIIDWREPNVMRAAPVPLYNSFTDVARFVQALKDAIKEG